MKSTINSSLKTRCRAVVPILVFLTFSTLAYLRLKGVTVTLRRPLIAGLAERRTQSLLVDINDCPLSSKHRLRSALPNRMSLKLHSESAGRRSLTAPSAAGFDPYGTDTLVFIHIQKTGGSEFLRYLVTATKDGDPLCKLTDEISSIKMGRRLPKKKKEKGTRNLTNCPRDMREPAGEQWLVSSKNMRWICGLHASYTEYKNCFQELHSPKLTEGSKFRYIVLLRHPVLRYISEFLHVQRNATWISQHYCGGSPVSETDMPPCYPGYYTGQSWPNLTLSGFVSCKSNWANNRHTMMLADLEKVGCYNRSYQDEKQRDEILLETAKKNLESFDYFGLTEYMNESFTLFESTFGVEFPIRPPVRMLNDLHSGPMLPNLWQHDSLFNEIMRANHLDMQLYEFALELFAKRAEGTGIAVNKELVRQELDILKANPQCDKLKYKKLNYTIS